MNDSELVQRLRAQDPDAVRELSDRFLPSVWRFVFYRVHGDRHLAEDIVSESVLALVRAVATDVDIENPGAWLRSVAAHKVLDHFRAAARVKHLVEQVQQTEEVAEHDDALKQQLVLERREEVRRVLDELPEPHRLALEWKYIEKLSVRAIAGRLDLTEKAAESVLFRARQSFREKVMRADAEQDGPPLRGAAVGRRNTRGEPVQAPGE